MSELVNGKPMAARNAAKNPNEWLLLASLPLLFLAAWGLSGVLAHGPGSDLDYYLGLAGGLLMLALFLYPLRKHARFAHGWGPLRFWFSRTWPGIFARS